MTSQLIVGSIVVGGASLAGLDTTLCRDAPQAEGGVRYVHYVFAIAVPIVNILGGMLIYTFPYHGERVEELVAKVKKLEAEIDLGLISPMADPREGGLGGVGAAGNAAVHPAGVGS